MAWAPWTSAVYRPTSTPSSRATRVAVHRCIALALAVGFAVWTQTAAAQTTAGPPVSGIARQSFLDASGHARDFEWTYEHWLASSTREANVVRGLLETAALLALGTAYYWVDPLANSADWDYPSIESKLSFASVRFDNNLFATNHLLHPLAGASIYGFTRVNGFSPQASLATTAASSVLWEYALEYREQASINDMVFTPFGGVAIGEFVFQLGDYLNSAPNGGGTWQRAAAATLGFPQNIHDAIDGASAPREPPLDSLGFSSAYHHRFRLGYLGSFYEGAGGRHSDLHGFEVAAELAQMPGFLRPGNFSTTFANGNFVEMRARASWGTDGDSETDLWFATDLFGRYDQDIRGFRGGEPVGQAALVGLSTAFRFNQRDVLGDPDRFAIAHVFGPHAAFWLGGGGVLSRFDVSLHADFAGIHPIAYPIWILQTQEDGVKSILARQSYSYALGFSARFRALLSARSFEAGASVSYGEYHSVQGVDRQQAAVVHDLATQDDVVEYQTFARLVPEGTPLAVGMGAELLHRYGTMGYVQTTRDERRLLVFAGVAF